MTAINFPDSPSVNDTHVVGDTTWVYDGSSWIVQSVASSGGSSNSGINTGKAIAMAIVFGG